MTAAFSTARTHSQRHARFTQDSWDRMRAFFVASLIAAIIGAPICTAASAHDSWFVRVCPAKN
jgi:hypothetical protein